MTKAPYCRRKGTYSMGLIALYTTRVRLSVWSYEGLEMRGKGVALSSKAFARILHVADTFAWRSRLAPSTTVFTLTRPVFFAINAHVHRVVSQIKGIVTTVTCGLPGVASARVIQAREALATIRGFSSHRSVLDAQGKRSEWGVVCAQRPAKSS